MNKEQIIQLFVSLGDRFAHFGDDERSRQVITDAIVANSWFSEREILHAIDAIRIEMLDEKRLRSWLDNYPSLPARTPRNILVIMAGNIPLVGFFDLLCVIASGNRCLVKPSSKDSILMQYAIDLLHEIEPATPVEIFDNESTPDAVIATGSDNAVRHFQAKYGSLPILLRGSRSSVAVLTGKESNDDLHKLSSDIYLYSGLGCRNISLVFAPENFEIARVANTLREYEVSNRGYLNNYRQCRALMIMNKVGHIDLGHSLMVEERAFPTAISQINVARYSNLAKVADWLAEHDQEIQCISSNDSSFIEQYSHICAPLHRSTALGSTQMPTLTAYPDSLDVMEWIGK